MSDKGGVGIFKSSIASTENLRYKCLQDDLTVTEESEKELDTPSSFGGLRVDFTQSLDDSL